MQEDARQNEALSAESQDVMRHLVAAFRAVKLYPPNNPIYAQSVRKSHEALSRFLAASPEYRVGVQKTNFTCQHVPVGKDAQLNKAIAQDLFAKGIREIVFSTGLTEGELLVLCKALALTAEEMAIKSGISSILWETDATHITVAEAGLDEVITTQASTDWNEKQPATSSAVLDPSTAKKEISFSGRTLVLGELVSNPADFGASMVELAKQTRSEHESVEDRLFSLYQEAGRKIKEGQSGQDETLFEALAQSALSIDPPYREGLIVGKLYGSLDEEIAKDHESEADYLMPGVLDEIRTGRFSDSWSIQQVAELLKKSTTKKVNPPVAPPSPASFEVTPLADDLEAIAKEMSVYTAEEMEAIKSMSEAGVETDVLDAAIRTLVDLLPLIKSPGRGSPGEKERVLFSGVVRQLEDLLGYVLKKKDYVLAAFIVKAFHKPADPAFAPRLKEALGKTVSRTLVAAVIAEMRKHPRGSQEYRFAYEYLTAVAGDATGILLELLAEERDRAARIFILDLLKDLGKNQILLLGERLSDDRWYVVRNVVNILSESKNDQAITLLRKVADHKDVRIRQEVIKGLLTIGGKKAAIVLAKFLDDRDADIQMMAVRAFGDLPGTGAEEASSIMDFLEVRPLAKREQELTIEAIKTMGKIGGPAARQFLNRYDRVRWWRSRKLQAELREAAQRSAEEISRRLDDGRRAQR